MPRFFPPHLMVLFGLLICVVWMLLVRFFQRSVALQLFVAEILGDETPDMAIRNFYSAKQRLEKHLEDADLNPELRQDIETALRQSIESDSIMSDLNR